jgi:site-specific recombinase XerD
MITETAGDAGVIEGTAVDVAAHGLAALTLGTARRRDENPYYAYTEALDSPLSQRKMRQCLDQVACLIIPGLEYGPDNSRIGARFPWEQLRQQHTAKIRSAIAAQGWSPSYANCCLVALRKVLEAAWELELMDGEDYQRARKKLTSIKGYRVPAGRNIRHDEILRMLEVCRGEDSLLGMRDTALILMLWSTGAREAEAAGMLIENYDASERSQKVLGKRNKERFVYVHENAAPEVERWMAALGARSGPVFRPIDKWGRVAGKPLSPESVYYIINRRRTQAGLPPLTPHDFRRTFTGDVLDAGAHLPQAQQLNGHDSVHTTAKYVRHNARELRAAVDRIPIPAMPDPGVQQ